MHISSYYILCLYNYIIYKIEQNYKIIKSNNVN
uniref:Uncharacterized protein n=1 Tax=viral metagenome TaxID=1070528 RepID=A0A6C0AY90_9ZZZZ